MHTNIELEVEEVRTIEQRTKEHLLHINGSRCRSIFFLRADVSQVRGGQYWWKTYLIRSASAGSRASFLPYSNSAPVSRLLGATSRPWSDPDFSSSSLVDMMAGAGRWSSALRKKNELS